MAPQVQVQGISLLDFDSDASVVDPELATKVDEALRIVEHYTPARFGRCRRDVRRIVLRRLPGLNGCYDPSMNAVVLDRGFVRGRGNARVALTFVHEATHARLRRRGIGYPVELRARVERVCVRAELALAERIPGSEAVLRELARALERPGLTDEQLGGYELAQATAAGAPAWVIGLIKRRYGLG